MSTFLRGSEIGGMYLGSNEISEMYLGSNLIYSSGWPYETLRISTDGGRTWTDHGRPVKVRDQQFWNKGVTHVEIPDSVVHIGVLAFSGNELESLHIPESVKTIDHHAFRKNKLTYVEFPENLDSIGSFAFWENPVLAEVRISSRTTYAYNSFIPSTTNIIIY